MASDHASDSLLSGDSHAQHVFPVSVHASRGGGGEPTTPEDSGDPGRGVQGYSLRRDRKRSFTEFDANDSDQYPYSEEDIAAPARRRARFVHPLLDFSVLADGKPSKVRVRNWTHPETKSLLAIWGDPEVQNQLRNSVHNNWIWERISVLIGQRHPEFQPARTAAQCKERLTYLRKQYRKAARLRARGKWANVGNIQIYLDELHSVLGKRQSGKIKPAAAAASAPSTSSSTATSSTPPPTSSTAPQPAGTAVPSLPEVPESDYEEDEDDDDDEEGGLEETEGEDIQDLFGQSQTQDVEIDFSAEMSENNINKTTEPVYTSFNPTAATNSSKAHKRPASSPQQNPKRPRGRPKANAPPRDDLTIAQAITDAMMRFIDHQSFHLTEQTKLLQRYLKFERARMRWEMDMETRRMKWEEEREMREEERRERQEELQAKRVSDNREFMLQMAVVLGNGAAGASKDSASTKN